MASTSHTKTAPVTLSLEFSAAIHHAAQAVADFRAYRTTVRALKRLSDDTLADLGIARADIHAEAHKAVYGV